MIRLDDLHEQQQRLLRYIWQFDERMGYPPTYDEMRDALDFKTKSHVNYHLQELGAQGLITRTPNRSRSVRLTNLGLHVLGALPEAQPRNGVIALPVLGHIVAGEPVLTDQTMETVEITRDIVPDQGENLYGLRVRGDSMIGAHIRHGDIVIMRRQDEHPRNGDIVAVRLRSRDEVTLKHFYQEKNTVRLVPANPDYQVIEVPAGDVEVQGRVMAVIRQY